MAYVLCFIAGAAAGALIAFTLARARAAAERAVLATRLEEERKASAEKLALLDEAQRKLSDAFQALSADALRNNNQSFLDLARGTLENARQAAQGELERLVVPVRDSLARFERRVAEIESSRAEAYGTLTEQVRSLAESQSTLRAETVRLVNALRAPGVRGNWGEMQLRRVVEMAGMLEHCDFDTQVTANGDARLRPDLVVRLPGGKNLVVDSKAPLEAYLAAMEAGDESARRTLLATHAAQVRAHITALARKSYWEQFDPAPEFVVLFLPGECFFSAALENDPALIEFGVNQRILLATPTTLIALLKAAAYGWRQEALARNAAEISRLGKELYKRLSDMGQHWVKLGKSLDRAVEAYNSAVGSMESRVMVTARKFEELETSAFGVRIEELEPVDSRPRSLATAPPVDAATAP